MTQTQHYSRAWYACLTIFTRSTPERGLRRKHGKLDESETVRTYFKYHWKDARQICLQAVCKDEILLSLGQVFGMVFELSTPKFGQNEDLAL